MHIGTDMRHIRRPLTICDAVILLDSYAAIHADNPSQRKALTESMAERLLGRAAKGERMSE